MKSFTSIKVRITIWYTALMLVLTAVVLTLIGTLSYRLSTDNMEKNIRLRVSQISDKVGPRPSGDVFRRLDSDEEFKSVSIYRDNGEYVVGQYSYDVASVPFENDRVRREKVGGNEYIIYDVFKPSRPGDNRGHWIRGAESVNYARVFGNSAFAIILAVIPVTVFLTAIGGYCITKKAFLPVNDIVRTADSICEENNISQRIQINPEAREDELFKLSVTLNRMLDKIEGLISQEKQFTSDASHELRTPISVILAQGEYLCEIAENEKEKELAQNIVSKAKEISKLVSQLLLIARIDQNKQKINKERVDLGVLADIAVAGLKEFANEKNISLITDIPENIMVDADEALLLSVMTNLISNGIKYGKASGKVVVSALKNDGVTEITVADDGIGIAEENIDKIWDRFYRVDDVRNDEYGSNGLGLSMVKSIVGLHGGEISVESKIKRGTKFKLILN